MATTGFSRVLTNRHFEDYRSAKQHFKGRHCKEFIISGTGNSVAAGEFQFASETLDYEDAEAQAYIRTEADDEGQDDAYVYIIYQDDDGVIYGPVTADLANPNTEEIAIGSTNFYRLREMWSEVESATAGGKMVMLCDDEMAGDDNWGYIDDGNSRWAAQRYFVPSATQVEHAYLGRVIAQAPQIAAAAAAVDAIILTITYTPKAIDNIEASAAADLAVTLTFNKELDWQPMIELEPATDVYIEVKKVNDALHDEIYVEASYLEVYARV